MSLLWIKHPKQKKKKGKINAPSLKLVQNLSGPFSGQNLNENEQLKNNSRFTKGTSPRAFLPLKIPASMTIEAAMVLPMFLLFFLMLGSGMEMLRFHSKMQMALWEIGRETCVYGTALKQGEMTPNAVLEQVGEFVLSQTYVKDRIEQYLGKEYLREAPVQPEMEGWWFLAGAHFHEDDTVELTATYTAQPQWILSGFQIFMMRNYFFGRSWTGYELKEGENELFYLAENAQVYHRDANCSHIKLQPELVSSSELDEAVNGNGQHYRACSICARGSLLGEIWISPEGDCYHYRRDCPGLKRTIRAVTWDVAKKYRPCSRCGREGE